MEGLITIAKDFFCQMASVLVVMVSFLLSFQIIDTVKQNQADSPPGFRYPQFSDLVGGLYCFVFIAIIRLFLSTTLFKWLGEYVINPKYQGTQREERVERFGIVFFKLFYFSVSSFIGYQCLKDAEWLPPSLGGTGKTSACWTSYPFAPYSDDLKLYYMISLGYHLHSFAFHLFLPRRNDFLEMLLHHLLAIFLVSFSFISNMIRIGSLVLLVHDLADIPGYAVKSSVDTKNTILTLILYFLLLLVWGYCRLYVFPVEIIWSGMFETTIPSNTEWVRYFLLIMLYGLQILHIFWYYLFIQMGLHFLNKGETQDLQNKIDDSSNSNPKPNSHQNAHNTRPAEKLQQDEKKHTLNSINSKTKPH